MPDDKQSQNSAKKSGTRYACMDRFENGTSGDPEGNDAGSIKNFLRTFVPMKELDESPDEG